MGEVPENPGMNGREKDAPFFVQDARDDGPGDFLGGCMDQGEIHRGVDVASRNGPGPLHEFGMEVAGKDEGEGT